MWYQILTFATMTTQILCHTPKNNSDVIVTYSGHAEAVGPMPEPKPKAETTTEVGNFKILIPESYATETTVFYEDDTEGVVFVPNEKAVFRNEEYNYRENEGGVNVGDVVSRRRISDVINDKNIRVETEPPNPEILFISGKNSEHAEKEYMKETEYAPKTSVKEKKKFSIDCSNLDCNNTLKPICGGKMENKNWRYRLFMNECYFRKVNCGFKYDINRFREMPSQLCKEIGSHHSERPSVYNPVPPSLPRETPAPIVLRRSASARRSLNLDIDGSFCSHVCPTSCPEDYSPECAVTSSGQRKVFVNHCKLDFNSCTHGTVWHRRPLSECVGTKKADFQQNRAFIGWMQRIGIVDNKGRLVVE